MIITKRYYLYPAFYTPLLDITYFQATPKHTVFFLTTLFKVVVPLSRIVLRLYTNDLHSRTRQLQRLAIGPQTGMACTLPLRPFQISCVDNPGSLPDDILLHKLVFLYKKPLNGSLDLFIIMKIFCSIEIVKINMPLSYFVLLLYRGSNI